MEVTFCKRKSTPGLLVALATFMLTAIGLLLFGNSKSETPNNASQSRTAVVALVDIPDGKIIAEDSVAESKVNPNSIPIAAVEAKKDVTGRISAGILKHQIIVLKRIKTKLMGEPEAPCGAWPINSP